MRTWIERRADALFIASVTPGYSTPRLGGERHIGRVIMSRRGYGPWRAGLYRSNTAEYAAMSAHFATKHKHATQALPK